MESKIITNKAVRQALHDYWQQYKAYPFQSIVAFLMPALGSILVFFVPPLIVAKLVNIFVAEGRIPLIILIKYVSLFGGLWILGEIFWRIGFHFLISLETKGINNLAKNAFNLLADRDYNFYINNFVGSLTKKSLAFSKNFETFTDTLVFNVVNNIFPFIFVIIVLWRYSPWIPIILIICLIIVIIIAVPIIRRRSKIVAERHVASSNMVGRLSDSLTNMLAVKSFAKEKQEYITYGKYVDEFTIKFKEAADYQNLKFDTKVSPLYVGTNVIGLIMAIFFTQKFGLQAGAIIIVFSYYSQITRMFWEINRVYRTIESSMSEAAEFTQMFIEPPIIQDTENADTLKISEANISFNHAGFKYDFEKEKDEDERGSFLNDFNLDIKGNQKIGLVGPSGGGKTTITKLLLRFIDLQEGSITVDGQDIKEVTQKSLRENIAYVPQEPLLFHRTLLENISYGDEKATEDDVLRAAKIAHADDFINQLPQGYQTLVGERGIKLSGGQRQRVAIARALLKNSPILILDEATSSLDSESEKYIQEGLLELMKGKTAIVIAHRLSTIKHLDRIIVLDHGKIVEDGTHDELVKKKGLYAKLWSHQSGEFL